MTLREYYAGLAMQALTYARGMPAGRDVREARAAEAVALAHALIASLGSDPRAPVFGPVTGNVNACVTNDVRVKP